jgi:Cu(I)/Ag(I) efflux system membrane fusion protein
MAISAGLAPGETVVTSGQFLIDSEASLKSGLQRLSGPEETRP